MIITEGHVLSILGQPISLNSPSQQIVSVCCTKCDQETRWVLFFFNFYFWLRWVFVAARGLSLVAASGGYSLVAVSGLLIVVASLVAEHGP